VASPVPAWFHARLAMLENPAMKLLPSEDYRKPSQKTAQNCSTSRPAQLAIHKPTEIATLSPEKIYLRPHTAVLNTCTLSPQALRQGLRQTRAPVFNTQNRTSRQKGTVWTGQAASAPREGVVALADSLVQKPRPKPGEGGTVRHGLLVREAPLHCELSGAARPQTAAPASLGALKARSGSVKTVSSTGEKGGANNVGTQTDSPKRWVAGRGATYALSPVDTYRGGVTVNSRQPEGPFVHGEDIRFMGPKKRGGIGQSQGVKALTASGRLMGSEVRAWWPDEAPPDDGYIPQHGETTLWQSSPFAIGRGMDQYDRRTFGPNMSNTEWVATCKELKYASTKLSEMERSLRKGMLERTKALGREVSIASKPYWPVSKTPGSMASAALSQQSTRPSCAGTASEAGLRPADTVISTGSHIPGYVMGGTLKVNDWLSPNNPSSEASILLDAGKLKTRVIPDYEKLERGARFGDGVLKTMRGQEVLDESLRMRDDPPRADQQNKRAERPHAIRNF